MARWTTIGGGTLLALVAVAAFALPGSAAETQALRQKDKAGLKAFRSCPSLLRYVKKHPKAAAEIRPAKGRGGEIPLSGGGGGRTEAVGREDSAGSPSPPSSGTNVQEEGVDEPDIVKAEGGLLFVLSGGRLHAIESGPGAPRKLGSLRLRSGDPDELIGDSQLFLHQGKALVLTDSFEKLTLREIDVSNPAAMRVLRTLKVDGTYVDARLHGATARIVLETVPKLPPLPLAGTGEARAAPPKLRVRRPGKLIPGAVLNDRVRGRRKRVRLVPCAEVSHPRTFSGLEMLTVLTFDLSAGLSQIDSDAVLTNGDVLYASPQNLYVATDSWFARGSHPSGSTEIHKFSIGPADTTYSGSGQVPGRMLSQWSMSEHEGMLRVASTTDPTGGRRRRRQPSQSLVTVLDSDSAGSLAPIGQVGGLGRGERIQAVRFIGETGFVVTFRQIDPLYTLDLSQPTAPRVLGELKIRGYSAYLHPVGDDRLLGVGQDATEEGELRGTQLSLFDISDLANPVLVDQVQIGGDSTSEAEFDHHAFLHWPPTSLSMIPVDIFSSRTGRPLFAGAVGVRSTAGSVDEVARIAHGEPPGVPVLRASVAAGRLNTVSQLGVLVSDLDTFAPLGWVPLSEPARKKRVAGG